MKMKAVTIYDIAKEAGVSTATVSRVIAGNYSVSEKTKKKVEEIIEEHDFHPNAIARSLSNRRSKVLGFIAPSITNEFFSQVFVEVEKCALEKGYSVLLGNSMHSRELESRYIRMLLDQQAEGIILLGGLINDTRPDQEEILELKEIQKQTKLVMINGKIEGLDNFSVRTDEARGIELIVDHLVEQGHKKIGLIGGVEGITTTDIKVETYKKALNKHHLVFKPSWQIYSEYDISSGEQGFARLLQANEELPTALIGINDMIGIGLVKAARKYNKDHFSIVGFDNTTLSCTSSPELTTIAHPYEELGRIAVEMMDDEYRATKQKEIILPPNLIVRESTIRPI